MQRVGQRRHLRAPPHQHRRGARAHRQRVPGGSQATRDPGRLVVDGLAERDLDRACPGAGVRAQRDRHRAGAQRLGHRVRRRQDGAVVAEAGGQRIDGGRRGVGPRERDVEGAHVAGTRTAPAVDRLERIADRGDRVPAAEQPAQHDDLRVAGVLVLVEQHCAVARPLDRGDLVELRQRRGQAHLVAEVDGGHRPFMRWYSRTSGTRARRWRSAST